MIDLLASLNRQGDMVIQVLKSRLIMATRLLKSQPITDIRLPTNQLIKPTQVLRSQVSMVIQALRSLPTTGTRVHKSLPTMVIQTPRSRPITAIRVPRSPLATVTLFRIIMMAPDVGLMALQPANPMNKAATTLPVLVPTSPTLALGVLATIHQGAIRL